MEIAKDENSTCFIKFIDEKALVFANIALRHDYVEGTETSPVGYLEGVYLKENYWKKRLCERACRGLWKVGLRKKLQRICQRLSFRKYR